MHKGGRKTSAISGVVLQPHDPYAVGDEANRTTQFIGIRLRFQSKPKGRNLQKEQTAQENLPIVLRVSHRQRVSRMSTREPILRNPRRLLNIAKMSTKREYLSLSRKNRRFLLVEEMARRCKQFRVSKLYGRGSEYKFSFFIFCFEIAELRRFS